MVQTYQKQSLLVRVGQEVYKLKIVGMLQIMTYQSAHVRRNFTNAADRIERIKVGVLAPNLKGDFPDRKTLLLVNLNSDRPSVERRGRRLGERPNPTRKVPHNASNLVTIRQIKASTK